MGYHKAIIPKGELGSIDKVKEEVLEFEDALEQGCVILQTCELADIYGALEALAGGYGLLMMDLKLMSDLTKSAFKDGTR